MSEELESALQKSRSSAVEIGKKIQQTLDNYAKGDGKTADTNILKYGYSALRSICMVVSRQHTAHLDVYCDIVKRILLPYCRPALSPSHWVRYLENLRYLFYTTIQTKRYAEATLIFDAVAAQNGLLQNQNDYKALLYIYSMYLLMQRSQQQSDAKVAAQQISAALKALTKLFQEMLQLSVQSNHEYPELMTDFGQHFCKQYNFFAAMGEERVQMYEALFALLKGAKTQLLSHPSAMAQSQSHLELLNALVQIDVIGQLRHPIALLHLHLCRELPRLQQDKTIGYTFTMLYYYIKFTYAQGDVANFNTSYTGLCQKFVSFLHKSTDEMMREQWYMDYLVVLCLMLVQLHHRGNACFSAFWTRLNGNIDCYATHMELLLGVIKLAARITASKRAPWTCCSSVQRHVILSLAQCGLSAYSHFTTKLQATDLAPAEQVKPGKNIEDVQKTLSAIVQQGITTIASMACIPSGDKVVAFAAPNTSIDLKTFYAYFTQLVREANTPQLAAYVLALAEHFARIRTQFTAGDWVTFLHRLTKLATQCRDEALVNELHTYFVTSMLLEPSLDWTQLRGQVSVYHTPGERVPTGRERRVATCCLLECWQRGRSQLKPALNAQQMRLLHWLETQHLFKYQKATEPLQQSLLQCAQTPYDRVMLVRQAKLKASSACSQLQPQCAEWRARGTSRTRLEHLMLAHACTLLLAEARETQHKINDVDNTLCMEDNMEQLLQRDSFQTLKVSDELLVVDVALEALTAFTRFHELFDAAPISMDEAYVDWEAITEDVIAIAQYLHLVGYVEHALRAWILLYHIAHTLTDNESVFRALTFCCEHVEYFDGELDVTANLELRAAIVAYEPHLLQSLLQLPQLKKRQQGYLLVCLCQLAYYHAHVGHNVYAQQLLQFVLIKHDELPERSGKCDLVRSTRDAVYVRILWKKLHQNAPRHEVRLVQRCLLRMMDETLERFREFVFISTSDSMPYMCLLFDLTQQMAECAANRLYDSNVNVLFVSVLRLALQYGTALRVVQLLTMWMLVNLQMEYVKKAEVKQRFIESLLGVTYRQQPEQGKHALSTKKKALSVTSATVDEMFSLQVNLGLQTMRKVVPSNVSPIRMQKLEISPTARRRGLRTFLRTNTSNSDVQCTSDWLNWCHFAVGCLNARLYYLIEDYEQLDDFYTHTQRWLQARNDNFNRRYFRNFQLLAMQHYVNYLRARGKHDVALQQLDDLQARVQSVRGKVDVMYGVNVQLQRRTIHVQLQRKCAPAQERAGRAQLRRALTFNLSFEERQHQQQQQQRLKTSVYTPISVGKTPQYKTTSMAFKIFSSDDDCMMMPPETPMAGATAVAKEKKARNREFNTCQAIDVWDLLDSSDEEPDFKAAKMNLPKPLPSKTQTQSVPAKRKVIATSAPDTQTQCASTAAKTARRTPARTRVAAAKNVETPVAVVVTPSAKGGGDSEQQQLNEMFSSLTVHKVKPPNGRLTIADIDRALNTMDITETPYAGASATPAAVVPAVSNAATKRGRPKKATLVKQKRTVEDAGADNEAMQTPVASAAPPIEKPKSRQRKIPNTTAATAASNTPAVLSSVLKEFATPITTAAVKTRRRAIGSAKRENDENAELLVIGLSSVVSHSSSSSNSTSTSSRSSSIVTSRRRRERT